MKTANGLAVIAHSDSPVSKQMVFDSRESGAATPPQFSSTAAEKCIAWLRNQLREAEWDLARARCLNDPHAIDAAKERVYQLRDRIQIAVFAEALITDSAPSSP